MYSAYITMNLKAKQYSQYNLPQLPQLIYFKRLNASVYERKAYAQYEYKCLVLYMVS